MISSAKHQYPQGVPADAVAEPVWAAGTVHRRLCCWRRERVVSRRKRTTMSPETEAVLDIMGAPGAAFEGSRRAGMR